MTNHNIYTYTERYLRALNCHIIHQGAQHLTVKLSAEADREIMERPLYWNFVERVSAEPEPLTVTFHFADDAAGGEPPQTTELLPSHHSQARLHAELLQFGCRRLHLMYQSALHKGRFVRLYVCEDPSSSFRGLTPWLWLNYKISYVCDQKKDRFYAVGFNLVNGELITQFDQAISSKQLSPKIPDYMFRIRPIFSLKSARQKVQEHIAQMLRTENMDWATKANMRLDEELELMHNFYGGQRQAKDQKMDTSQEEAFRLRVAAINNLRPYIQVGLINAGLIYLQFQP